MEGIHEQTDHVCRAIFCVFSMILRRLGHHRGHNLINSISNLMAKVFWRPRGNSLFARPMAILYLVTPPLRSTLVAEIPSCKIRGKEAVYTTTGLYRLVETSATKR